MSHLSKIEQSIINTICNPDAVRMADSLDAALTMMVQANTQTQKEGFEDIYFHVDRLRTAIRIFANYPQWDEEKEVSRKAPVHELEPLRVFTEYVQAEKNGYQFVEKCIDMITDVFTLDPQGYNSDNVHNLLFGLRFLREGLRAMQEKKGGRLCQ